jgi:hypothetical protein
MTDIGSPDSLFAIYLVAALDIYSFISSSPQTVELNAKTRAPTLMKYVNIGSVGGIAVGLVGMTLAPKGSKMWPIIGAGTGVVFAHFIYQHAKQAGLSKPGVPTEKPLPAEVTNITPVYRGQALVSAQPGGFIDSREKKEYYSSREYPETASYEAFEQSRGG